MLLHTTSSYILLCCCTLVLLIFSSATAHQLLQYPPLLLHTSSLISSWCATAEEDIKQQDREECNPWERPPAPHQSPLTILLFRRLHHPSSILSTSFIPYSISSILLLCPSLILLNRQLVASFLLILFCPYQTMFVSFSMSQWSHLQLRLPSL